MSDATASNAASALSFIAGRMKGLAYILDVPNSRNLQ